MSNKDLLVKKSSEIKEMINSLSDKATDLNEGIMFFANQNGEAGVNSNNFVLALTIFILACMVGYHIVWRVTPALHTPLMAVTNAISGIVIIGAMIAAGSKDFHISNCMGIIAVILASINIFGGFFVTYRMLSMFRKR
jgi:NAD(P) transhydrogenase subunit alpha